jgi:hypothetical protein
MYSTSRPELLSVQFLAPWKRGGGEFKGNKTTQVLNWRLDPAVSGFESVTCGNLIIPYVCITQSINTDTLSYLPTCRLTFLYGIHFITMTGHQRLGNCHHSHRITAFLLSSSISYIHLMNIVDGNYVRKAYNFLPKFCGKSGEKCAPLGI